MTEQFAKVRIWTASELSLSAVVLEEDYKKLLTAYEELEAASKVSEKGLELACATMYSRNLRDPKVWLALAEEKLAPPVVEEDAPRKDDGVCGGGVCTYDADTDNGVLCKKHEADMQKEINKATEDFYAEPPRQEGKHRFMAGTCVDCGHPLDEICTANLQIEDAPKET